MSGLLNMYTDKSNGEHGSHARIYKPYLRSARSRERLKHHKGEAAQYNQREKGNH